MTIESIKNLYNGLVESYIIFMAIKNARYIQDFLWGKKKLGYPDFEEMKLIIRKRIHKIEMINPKHHNAVVELRKRLLQNAAVSVAFLALIKDEERIK
jgi:hypothetical protein